MDIKVNAKDNRSEKLYAYDYYNVKFYAQNPLDPSKNVLANIRNQLVKAMNEHKERLPRLLIIFPEDDILKFINFYTYGVSTITGKCLS